MIKSTLLFFKVVIGIVLLTPIVMGKAAVDKVKEDEGETDK